MSSDAARGRGGSRRRAKGRPYTKASSPSAEDKARVLNPLLLSAAQRVISDSLNAADDIGHWADAADELATLTLAVQAATADQDLRLESGTTPELRRNLLKQLEDELRRDSRGDPATDDPMVSALGHIRHALEPDGDASVGQLVSSPHSGELLAEIAHDLRSPLTSILTLSEAIRRGQSGEVNDIQRRQLGLIYNAALALSSTASDLIELAHGGDRLAQKEPSPFSLTEMLDSIRDMVCPMAEEKGLILSFQTEVSERRLGYPLALSRVLLNLVTNALKFTEEGGVEITAHPVGPIDLEFAVRDTGKGIDAHAMATLYQPFRRAAGRAGYCFSGTGLGLVICRRLIAAMGSELQLETRPGWGTRFHFRVALPPANPLA